MLRGIGMFLLACTGIGAIYMLARMRSVAPGNVGIVRNDYSGEIEILQPGTHCLLSPFRSFVEEAPNKEREVFTSTQLTLHTADNIDIDAKVDIQYKVNDAKKTNTMVVGNYQIALVRGVETALSRVIAEHNYTLQKLSSSRLTTEESSDKSLDNKASLSVTISSDSKEDSRINNSPSVSFSSASSAQSLPSRSLLGELSSLVKAALNTLCGYFGIEVVNIQIVNFRAKDKEIERQIESSSRAQFDAQNSLLSAKADQKAKAIRAETDFMVSKKLAESRAKTLEIETAAQTKRIDDLSKATSMDKSEILKLDVQKEMVQSLSNVRGTVFLPGTASNVGLLSAVSQSSKELKATA